MTRFILPRYILREHLGPFFFGFAVITLIFLLNLVFRELSRMLSKGLPWNVVLEFFALNLAWIIALAVPMAVLMATLMAFGRLAADNEITAMKASGVSIYRIVTPILFAASLIAIGMIWFNNAVLPDFNHRARILAGDIARKKPGVSIEPGVWYKNIPDFGLLVQELVDSIQANGKSASSNGVTIARNLLITDHSDPDHNRTISARRGYIELNPRLGALVLTLFDGEVQEIDFTKMEELRHVSFTKHVLSIAVDDMFLRRSESEYRGDREKSAPQMRQEVQANQQLIAESLKALNEHVGRDLQRAVGSAFGLVAAADSVRSNYQPPARADSLTAVERQQRLTALVLSVRQTLYHIENQLAIVRSYERSNKGLLVEIHKKYSIPVACLVFVIIGAPLGFMARRGGLATGGGLSLGFFLLYWASLIGGEDLADREFISPFVAMWSANFIVGALGLYLLRRAAQENVTMDLTKLLWWRKGK
ncbi:MAG: LptF/LptG family permease [candidate division KSB1 bacterium]|nr:LptF/LptG family permease [candidate division KSB1 bacterium]MDZ7365957.1 LptF/LptG family permease [candidate division KSB1 bacterium]MDZ7404073.1 LptF/LptG family permease [candidate division KSB1 bacterium]